MAFIRKRGPFSFQVCYKENGKFIVDGTYDTEPEALKRVAEIKHDSSIGKAVDRKRGLIKVRDALKLYEDSEACKKLSYKKSGKYRYQIWLSDKHDDRLQFIDDSLSTITPAQIKKWLQNRLKSVSGSTANRDMNELSAFFSWCKLHYELDWFINPCESVKRPRENEERDRVLQQGSDEEIRLIEAIKASKSVLLYPAFVLAIETAVRRKELVFLRWDQVHDLESDAPYLTLQASQTKTLRKRSVPLSVEAVKAINMLKEIQNELKSKEKEGSKRKYDYNYVLCGLDANSFSHAFRKACEKANVEDLHWHDSRHTSLTRLMETNKFTITEVASVSGHTNLKSLSRYVNHNSQNIARKMRQTKN